MKHIALLLVLVITGCLNTTGSIGEVPEVEEEEYVECNRDIECVEYPTWQSWQTYYDGDSEFVCEPCWRNHHYEQRGDCCVCNPEEHRKWCSSNRSAIYFCSPLGEFIHRNCAAYCAWFRYSYGNTCVEISGEAQCDCRMEF
ncbi:MAG: hypothetical protein U9P90_02795 [Patescibacteria group bacterium]|nr:hypothetical protein [Patescibacteria group bacterium]